MVWVNEVLPFRLKLAITDKVVHFISVFCTQPLEVSHVQWHAFLTNLA